MTTERLYYRDAYLTRFTATVKAVDGARLWLDRTAFYPTSGGQPFDTGMLAGMRVIDVLDEPAGITHVLEAYPSLEPGAPIEGEVDWERRFDHMQQHTGQHLLSALFEDLAGAATVSVHFGTQSSTLDVDTVVGRPEVARVEQQANAVVTANRPVFVTFENGATAAGLRKAPDRDGEIRVVTIKDLDRSACGGTHVRTTGEIGAVLIRKVEKYKQHTRIEFLCGARAVHQARADYDALSAIAASLTAGIDEVPRLVAARAEASSQMEAERRRLREALARYRARELHDAATVGPDGIRRVIERGGTADELRNLAHAVGALSRSVFIGACGTPPTVFVATSEDSAVDAGGALKAALQANGGRGGGNPRLAQGTVPDAGRLEAVIRSLSAATKS